MCSRQYISMAVNLWSEGGFCQRRSPYATYFSLALDPPLGISGWNHYKNGSIQSKAFCLWSSLWLLLALPWIHPGRIFFPHAFWSLLCIRFVTVAFQSEEAVLWRRDPSLTYFCPTLDPALGGVFQKVEPQERGHEYFIPTKFRKHPLSSSEAKADYVFQYI